MYWLGYNDVCLLDDVLVIDQDYNKCHSGCVTPINFLRKLGFAIAWKKIYDPSHVVTYLGLDNRSMTISLPEDKRVKFAALLQDFAQCKRASKHQLQQLAGKLAYAALIVADGGRTYLEHVFDIMRPLEKPSHKAKLDAAFHADISWWLSFLQGHWAKPGELPPPNLPFHRCLGQGGGHGGTIWLGIP